MIKILEITLLFDFYGELLTPHQRQVFELYYLNDLSLGEISEQLGISRQGVHDAIKRTEKILYGYEDKLGLVHRFYEQKGHLQQILGKMESLMEHRKVDPEVVDELREIKNLVKQVIGEA